MRIEVDPALPSELAEALDAKGNLITRFAPALEDVPVGAAGLRLSVAAFDMLLAALDGINANKPSSY
jgi:hypothetical protein